MIELYKRKIWNDDKTVNVWESAIIELKQTLAGMQHHDTITGTSKAYVINNHVFKIEKALAGNSQMLSITVKKRVEGLYPNL